MWDRRLAPSLKAPGLHRIRNPVARRFSLFRLRDRRDEFCATPLLDDLLGRLPRLIEFPMPRRAFVGRIQDRMFEKGIGRSGPRIVSLFIIWRPENLLHSYPRPRSPILETVRSPGYGNFTCAQRKFNPYPTLSHTYRSRRLYLRMILSPLPLLVTSPFRRPAAASHVGQDDRSRRRINAARFRASLVQLRPASRRALRRGV